MFYGIPYLATFFKILLFKYIFEIHESNQGVCFSLRQILRTS